MAITSPLQSLSVRTRTFALTMIALAWLISSLWILPITLWPYIFPEDDHHHHHHHYNNQQSFHDSIYNNNIINATISTVSDPSFLKLTSTVMSSITSQQQQSSKTNDMTSSSNPMATQLAYLSNSSSINSSSLLLGGTDVVGMSVDEYDHASQQCTPPYDKSIFFKVATGVFNFYVPLFALIAINVRIYWTIHKSSRQGVGAETNGGGGAGGGGGGGESSSGAGGSSNTTGNVTTATTGGGASCDVKIRRIHRNNKQEKAFRYSLTFLF